MNENSQLKRIWRYGRGKFVVSLPKTWVRNCSYVLLQIIDDDTLLILKRHDVLSEEDAYRFERLNTNE